VTLAAAPPAAGAFARLRALLADVPAEPGAPPVDLHLGECRLGAPTELLAPLRDLDAWTRYPPLGGTAALRAAYRAWLGRRFGIDPDAVEVEPTPGTKQAVTALLARAVARTRTGGAAPAVVLPNPFYPTYLAGTELAGARPVLYPVSGGDTAAAGAAAVRAAVRTGSPVAAVVVCHPGNPRGDVLDAAALGAVADLAAAVDALLVVDECYVDLAVGAPPAAGYLGAAGAGAGPFAVLHSLSKRSAAPGLRSGFVAGDPVTVADYAAYNRACGVSQAHPVCAAAAALWADDAHVERVRGLLADSWDTADAVLGDVPGYHRPSAGFFLWLPVPDDEAVTRRLWRDHSVSVMPGRYLAAADDTGTNPGAGHLRVALARPAQVLVPALSALRTAVLTTEEGRT